MISGVKDKKNNNQKGKKEKMKLAKDPKQLVLAIVVMILFFGTTIRNIVIYYQDNVAVSQPSPEASTMAENRQKDLESVGQGAGPNDPVSNMPQDANNIYNETMKIKGETPGASAPKMPGEEDVDIMSSSTDAIYKGKKVLITVAGSGRTNPFLPAGEGVVPTSLPKFSFLPPPPEQLSVNSDADSVMGTTISGILYDKYSPSAIITIGGTDYLVKRGDVINRYHILSIAKDQVIVQLGKNVYKAGVGELLSQGQMNYNTISNLNKKFGGNSVSINVKKKGY